MQTPIAAVYDTAAADITYPIVDTGQATFYDEASAIGEPAEGDAFFGQDAHFEGTQPSYTLSADGLTVHDNVTGLTWTQSPDVDGDGDIDVDDKLTFDDAQTRPDALNAENYGGYSDWRLPTIKELYSLMDFRGTDPSGPDAFGAIPFIDTDYFDFGYGDTAAGERTIDAQFWSDNEYVGTVFVNQAAAFGLNLADGRIKGYPTGGPVTKTCYVYFVRGAADYGVNDFTDNGDGTVTDDATGLMWARDDSGAGMNWENALAWGRQMNDQDHLGYNDWRLPNAKEMQSLVDYSRAPDVTGSAAIDPVFNITGITNEGGEADYPWFWTGTTHLRANGSAVAGVYICFGRAMGYMNGAWIDVHGAGAQRSDEKGGDFSGFTYVFDGYYFAQSPQGDATRIYNYVRLVRDEGNDSDGDGIDDGQDGCPYDPEKAEPGICGCGASETGCDALYVAPPPDGDDDVNTGASPASPFATIQHAINQGGASSRDKIVLNLAAGVYVESPEVNQSKIFSIQGGWDMTFTTESSVSEIDGSLTINAGTVEWKNVILCSFF